MLLLRCLGCSSPSSDIQLDLTWCNPRSHSTRSRPITPSLPLLSSPLLSVLPSAHLLRLRGSGHCALSAPGMSASGERRICGKTPLWLTSRGLGGNRGGYIYVRGGAEARLRGFGIQAAFPRTGHRGAPLRCAAQPPARPPERSVCRGASACRHHVSGNSFRSRCVQD